MPWSAPWPRWSARVRANTRDQAAGSMTACWKCAAVLEPGDRFCDSCGANQVEAPEPVAGQPPRTLQNVLPILKRSDDTIWARVEEARDELYDTLRETCEAEGYEALVIKSGPFIQPASVRLEAWIPSADGKVSGRAWTVVEIHAKEYHRHPIEHSVQVHDRGWSKSYDRLVGFGDYHARQLARFVLGRGSMPLLATMRVRDQRWQFWRPMNKLDVLATDWMGLSPLILFVLGFAVMVNIPVLGLLLWVGGVVAVVLLRRRRAPVLSSGKPGAEPRQLHNVDAWQAVISGLGGDAATLRARLLDLFETPPMDDFESRVENIWAWGLDGIVDREQIVMTLRRGWVFCQIYGYRDELYVGWTSHVNSGQWVEFTVATGVDKQTRKLIRVNTVQRGRQPLTEYDLIDLNCLAEWTHARLVQLLQRRMEERKIDQEVDFKIIRGDRPGMDDAETPTEQIRRKVRRLVRTG
jgi:hypothetical protein